MNSLFENIFPTEHNVPENVANFQDDVYGVGAIVKAVRDMISGKVNKAIFKQGKHDGVNWVEVGGFMITLEKIDGKMCFRHNNASIVPSYNPHSLDDAYVVGCIIANFGHNVFRQKLLKKI